MPLTRKRELQIKRFIIGITVLIILGVSFGLLSSGIIHLPWTDKLLQEREYASNKGKDKKILVLGDSQLSYWELEHCLYTDIKRFCKEHDIGHVNAAFPGFGPIEYEDRLKVIGTDYQPDLILLFYYAGNDLTDVIYRENDKPKKPDVSWVKELEEAPSEKTNKPNPFDPSKPFLPEEEKQRRVQNSQFDWNKFRAMGVDSTIIEYAKNRVIYPGKLGPEFVNPHILVIGTWERNYLFDNCALNTTRSKFGWIRVLKRFESIVKMAEDIEADLFLVGIPSTVQVDDSHHDFYRKVTFNVGPELAESNMPQVLLDYFASQSHIPYVDLLPHFKEAVKHSELYFENDDHLNQKGHELAFSLVEKELLLPYLDGKLSSNLAERQSNLYKSYGPWAIEYFSEQIYTNTNWLNQVKQQAAQLNISVDSAVYLNAKYASDRL